MPAIIAGLINPQKLAPLGERAANPRVQKAVYWLEMARRDGQDITNVVTAAVERAGYTNALAAQLTGEALLRNWKIADGDGCLPISGFRFPPFSIYLLAWTTSSHAPCAPNSTTSSPTWS